MPVPKKRFGKTELQIPVLTCGGMRYQQSWQDDAEARGSVTEDNQKNLEACVRRALELGINHIETARGYGTSEYQLGKILPSLPRDGLIVQTKIGPKETPAEMLETFEQSVALLGLERIDLFAVHGINNEETLQNALRCLPALHRLKQEGRIGHIGFSTHGHPGLIVKAIETGEFDYVNLHWYFVYHPVNRPAVDAAAARDMGVFIISPNDKGGKLYEPPSRLTALCAPLSPMAFNDLYCLRDPHVHTLSIGVAKPSDFDEHVRAVQDMESKFEQTGAVERRLISAMEEELGAEWVARWHEGLPHPDEVPGGINIAEILRLWTFARGLDMVEFGKMRYNLLGNANHWFPGNKAADFRDEDLKPVLEKSPFAGEIPSILREAHALLNAEEQKRLSES